MPKGCVCVCGGGVVEIWKPLSEANKGSFSNYVPIPLPIFHIPIHPHCEPFNKSAIKIANNIY